MVNEPVDHGSRYHYVTAEDGSPAAESAIGAKNHATSLVATVHYLEEQVSCWSAEANVAYLVHDQ